MWYRVFCRSAEELPPGDLLAKVRESGCPVEARFRWDNLGWTTADFVLGQGTPVFAERYLTDTDELRGELNTWAAYLETLDYSPNSVPLMERVIQTKQVVTVRKPLAHPDEVGVEKLCETLCRTLAAAGDGVYQIEGVGWYAGDGTELVKEY
jgi:hypothetical protein